MNMRTIFFLFSFFITPSFAGLFDDQSIKNLIVEPSIQITVPSSLVIQPDGSVTNGQDSNAVKIVVTSENSDLPSDIAQQLLSTAVGSEVFTVDSLFDTTIEVDQPYRFVMEINSLKYQNYRNNTQFSFSVTGADGEQSNTAYTTIKGLDYGACAASEINTNEDGNGESSCVSGYYDQADASSDAIAWCENVSSAGIACNAVPVAIASSIAGLDPDGLTMGCPGTSKGKVAVVSADNMDDALATASDALNCSDKYEKKPYASMQCDASRCQLYTASGALVDTSINGGVVCGNVSKKSINCMDKPYGFSPDDE